MLVATRADPSFAEAWYNLSDLLDEQGRPEAAIECLRNALRAAPAYIDAMFNLALLLQRNNKHAEAADYWRRYLANDAQSEWATRARRSLKFCECKSICRRHDLICEGRSRQRDGESSRHRQSKLLTFCFRNCARFWRWPISCGSLMSMRRIRRRWRKAPSVFSLVRGRLHPHARHLKKAVANVGRDIWQFCQPHAIPSVCFTFVSGTRHGHLPKDHFFAAEIMWLTETEFHQKMRNIKFLIYFTFPQASLPSM